MSFIQIRSRMLLLVTTLLTLFCCFVLGEHSRLCFRPPGDSAWPNLKGLGLDYFPQTPDYWSLFYGRAEDKIDNGGLDISLRIFPLYKVKSNGELLHYMGWFRAQITVNDRKDGNKVIRDTIRTMVLWFEFTQDMEVIGHWASDDELKPQPTWNGCPRNDMTRYMGIYCGGASAFSSEVPNVVVYVRNDTFVSPVTNELESKFPKKNYIGYAVPPADTKQFNFYFRYHGVNSCNFMGQILSIQARFATEKGKTGLYHKTFRAYHDNSHITPEPIPTEEIIIDCTKEAKGEPSNDVGFSKAFDPPYWGKDHDSSELVRPWDDQKDSLENWRFMGCQANLFGGRCNWHIGHINKNGTGLQTSIVGNYPSYDFVQNLANDSTIQCELKKPDDIFNVAYGGYDKSPLTTKQLLYDDYIKTLEVECPIVYDPTPNDPTRPCDNSYRTMTFDELFEAQARLEEDSVFEGFAEYDAHVELDDPRLNPSEEDYLDSYDKGLMVDQFKLLWHIWQCHGIVNTLAILFLVPVSAFISRFYKESFHNARIFYTRFWYQIHMHSSAWTFVLIVVGLVITHVSRTALGPGLTTATKIHRLAGSMSSVSLIVVFFGSAFRTLEINTRKVVICCHWGWGTMLYISGLICIYSSAWIPGSPVVVLNHSSPTGRWSYTNSDRVLEPVVLITSAWLIVEFIMAIIMKNIVTKRDLKTTVVNERIAIPVMMPVIQESETRNGAGDGLDRTKICLFVYVITAGLATLVICWCIITNSTEGRGYGPLLCTHLDNLNPIYQNGLRTTCFDGK